MLASYLKHQDAVVVRSTLGALALTGHGTREVCEAVYARLNDANELIQIAALTCVTAWNNRRVMPLIIPKLESPSEQVANESANALKTLSGVDFAKNGQAWSAWYDAHQGAVNQRMAEFEAKLHDPNVEVVVETIDRLTSFHETRSEAAELIAPLQFDPDIKVSTAAVRAMMVVKPEDVDQQRMNALLVSSTNKPTAPVTIVVGPMGRGFLDSWIGILAVVFASFAAFAGSLFILRTPTVREATRRYLKPVAKRIAKSTARFVKPALRSVTDRIIRPVATGVARAAKAMKTERFTRPITFRIGKIIKPMTDRIKKSMANQPRQEAPEEPKIISGASKTAGSNSKH